MLGTALLGLSFLLDGSESAHLPLLLTQTITLNDLSSMLLCPAIPILVSREVPSWGWLPNFPTKQS